MKRRSKTKSTLNLKNPKLLIEKSNKIGVDRACEMYGINRTDYYELVKKYNDSKCENNDSEDYSEDGYTKFHDVMSKIKII